jgi:hypothetical protein
VSEKFKLVTVGELRRRYGLGLIKCETIPLNPQIIPVVLRPMLPYAELWGISDDFLRQELLNKASHEAKAELKQMVYQHEDELEKWLTGPEAKLKNPSPEYVAFAAMVMIADCIPNCGLPTPERSEPKASE